MDLSIIIMSIDLASKGGSRTRPLRLRVRETGHLSRADRMTYKGPEFAGGLQVDRRFDVEIIRRRSIKSRAAGRNEAEVRRGKPKSGRKERERRGVMP